MDREDPRHPAPEDDSGSPHGPADHPADHPADQDLALERTEFARKRTRLSDERTFASWLRTGLAATVAGLAVVRLLVDTEPPWLPKTVGSLMIIGGLSAYVAALQRLRKVRREIRDDREPPELRDHVILDTPFWLLVAIVIVLIASALVALYLPFS